MHYRSSESYQEDSKHSKWMTPLRDAVSITNGPININACSAAKVSACLAIPVGLCYANLSLMTACWQFFGSLGRFVMRMLGRAKHVRGDKDLSRLQKLLQIGDLASIDVLKHLVQVLVIRETGEFLADLTGTELSIVDHRSVGGK